MAYRGKYPRKLQSVWRGALNDFNNPSKGYSHWARSNDGSLFWIDPAQSNGVLPKIGADVDAIPACIQQEA